MMNRLIAPIAAALLLCACQAGFVDASRIPPSVYGPGVFVDDKAMFDARWAFGGNSTFPTDPAKAAHVAMVIEYLGGAVNNLGEWSDLAGTVQVQMLQARAEMRAALGVAPATRSQEIVDALVVVSTSTDPAVQKAALAAPFFTLGAEGTYARLQAMPPLPVTTVAIRRASDYHNRLSTAY